MATAPDITRDETRDLIAKGWVPPPEALEPYRHLLRPFYDGQGNRDWGKGKLDSLDTKAIAGIIAVFDHFGIAIPETPADAPAWDTVLRAYVAEHDRFSTEDAIRAVGWENVGADEKIMTEALGRMGLTWTFKLSENTGFWTKRKAA